MSPYSSYTSYQTSSGGHSPAPRRRRRRIGRLLIGILIIALIVGGYSVVHKKKSPDQTAANATTNTQTASASSVPPSNVTALGNEINNIIAANSNITFSVSTVDLNTGLSEHYGVSSPFDAASVGKLVTATCFLHELEEGKVSLSQTMSDGNTAQYDLQQMIVISDDSTWATLNDYLTHPVMEAYASDDIGMTNYDADNNTMTSMDVATLLTKLYEGKLLNPTDTQLLLGYMKQANYRGYMLPAIPSSYTVYHKVGLDVDNVHDVAIITKGKQAIILAIFTNGNGTYEWSERAQIMQQIASDTLKAYFTAP